MLEGFNRHYRLFRETSAAAKRRFEQADWHGQQRAQRDRIEFYDKRVLEAVERLRGEFQVDDLSMDSWQQAKLHYIGCSPTTTSPNWPRPSSIRSPPSCCTAATSGTTSSSCGLPSAPSTSKTTRRRANPPTAPTTRPQRRCVSPGCVSSPTSSSTPNSRTSNATSTTCSTRCAPNSARCGHVRISRCRWLASLFYRNKGAYVVGRIINGFNETPFALPILHGTNGGLVIDTALFGEDELLILFSFARAYSWSTWRSRRPTCSSCAR